MNKVEQIQEKEIELLKIFDDICQENDLVYYALGGTLLGAIRHKGFIPWDDDMDLGMPRKDYNRFIEIANEVLPEYIEFKIHEDNLNNTSIRDLSTEIVFGNTPCNPFIDIFPLDGYPQNGIYRFVHSRKILFYRMLSKISVIDQLIERDRGIVENAIVNISRILHLNKVLNTTKLNQRLQSVIQKYDFETSPVVGNILGAYREKELVPREVFGKPTRINFSGFMMSAHQQPEKYLGYVYGDYMQLPPEDKRIGHFVGTYGE